MKEILIVEDDQALCSGLCLALQSETVRPMPCHTLAEAGRALREKSFDLVILDCTLPDGNGLDLLRSLRTESAVPVLMLTANDLELDIVTGLESGADDYITKPFSLAVLRARVNALLRRGQVQALKIGPFRMNFAQMEFSKNGQPVFLSRTEQKLLQLLVVNRGQTLPRNLLAERIWGDGAFVDENALSVTVKRLRDKLEEDPAKPRYIRTVYGIGYQWRDAP